MFILGCDFTNEPQKPESASSQRQKPFSTPPTSARGFIEIPQVSKSSVPGTAAGQPAIKVRSHALVSGFTTFIARKHNARGYGVVPHS